MGVLSYSKQKNLRNQNHLPHRGLSTETQKLVLTFVSNLVTAPYSQSCNIAKTGSFVTKPVLFEE